MQNRLADETWLQIYDYLTNKEKLILSETSREMTIIAESQFKSDGQKLFETAREFETYASGSSFKIGYFTALGEINKNVKALKNILGRENEIIAYRSYSEQMQDLKEIIAPQCIFAKKTIEQYIRHENANVSNRYGITLLHNLICFDRPDLATLVIQCPQFKKINFRFQLPVTFGTAFDVALDAWTKNRDFTINFFELLLQYGAQVPRLEKSFLCARKTLFTTFLPFIVNPSSFRSQHELMELLCLLHRYGFSLTDMKIDFERQFDAGMIAEYKKKYSLSETELNNTIKDFMTEVEARSYDCQIGILLVEMDDERKDDGRSTLRIPTNDSRCLVM